MAKLERYEAVYARQSVDKEESVSIEAQIDDCKAVCSKKGTTIKVYQDKGFSGKNTERPDLQRLINDVKAGLISKIVVYKLDRISRNITDFYKLYEIMQANDCQFISRTENFDTTSSIGRAMMGILVVFAQMERENTQIRIKDNYQYRIKTGSWASGKAPYGFKNDKIDGVKTLTPVKEEMDVVKWMFKTYAGSPNISLGKIQSMLIENGMTGHQSKKGFSRTTINHILTNPIYAVADKILREYYQKKLIEFVNEPEQWDGSFAAAIVGKNGRSLRNEDLDGIKIYITNVKGTIDSRTFIMVQNRIEQNQQIASDNSPNHNLKELSGLLKCAECGSAVKMQASPTLTCTGRSQKKICSISFKGIKLETIQENVAAQVQEYLSGIHENVEQQRKRQIKTTKEIAKLEKEFHNLVELAKHSTNLSDALKFDMDNLIVKIKEKQLSLKTDQAEDVIWLRLNHQKYIGEIFDKDGNVLFSYKDLDTEKRQMILRELVHKIYVYPNGNIDIEWKE